MNTRSAWFKKSVICLVVGILLLVAGCGQTSGSFRLADDETVLAVCRGDIVCLSGTTVTVKDAEGKELSRLQPGYTFIGTAGTAIVFVDKKAALFDTFDTETGTLTQAVSVAPASKGFSINSATLAGDILWITTRGMASAMKAAMYSKDLLSGGYLYGYDTKTGKCIHSGFVLGAPEKSDVEIRTTLLAASQTFAIALLETPRAKYLSVANLAKISVSSMATTEAFIPVDVVGFIPKDVTAIPLLSADKKLLYRFKSTSISNLINKTSSFSLQGTEHIVQSGAFTLVSTTTQLTVLDASNVAVFSTESSSLPFVVGNNAYYVHGTSVAVNTLGTKDEISCCDVPKNCSVVGVDVKGDVLTVVVKNGNKISSLNATLTNTH